MRLTSALTLALLLSGCPSGRPPPPVSPDIRADASDGPGEAATPLAPDDPDAPDEPDEPGEQEPGRPAVSEPRAGSALADTLRAPTGRAGLPGGCEGGTRRPGESWRVDCNTCNCGDDGQSTCTAMACKPQPAL